MNNYYAHRLFCNDNGFYSDLTIHTINYYFIMNIGDALTLVRSSFNAAFETATLTANRIYTFQNKSGTVAFLSDITGSGTPSKTVTTVTSNTNILADDNNDVLRCNNTGSITITIPTSNNYAVGFVVDIIQVNNGQVTVSPGSGIILKMFGGSTNAVLIGQNARAQLIKLTSANEWHITGDVSI